MAFTTLIFFPFLDIYFKVKKNNSQIHNKKKIKKIYIYIYIYKNYNKIKL